MLSRPRHSADRSWLSLGEASRLLGVTASTLRRWADQGQVPVFITPGGHRRFSRGSIDALIPSLRRRRPPLHRLGASPDRFTAAYRRKAPGAPPPGWSERLGEDGRSEFRERGRQLLAALFEHLDASGPAEAQAALTMAEAAASSYGAGARRYGLSLTETVDGFLRFRQPFLGELARVARGRGLDTREATSLWMDAEAAMDRLLVAVMTGASSA